ncbi:MAG: TetR family transcriptional regulator [Ornithinimicrobium sp.]
MATPSATGVQDRRRRRTAAAITSAAQELVITRGLDGFTLDELAECAGLSRRTLFNYFPSKLDAVVGAKPELSADDEAQFVAGGPSGDLIEDVIAMTRRLVNTGELTSSELVRTRQVFALEPRLIAHANERLEHDCAHMVELILHREGAGFGRTRADLLIRVLACSLDVALTRFLMLEDTPQPSWADVLADTIREVRLLFR